MGQQRSADDELKFFVGHHVRNVCLFSAYYTVVPKGQYSIEENSGTPGIVMTYLPGAPPVPCDLFAISFRVVSTTRISLFTPPSSSSITESR